MKQKLEELRKKRIDAQHCVDSIDREISNLEKQMLNADANLCKGKWFYKSEDWWDDYDNCYQEYEIVHINDVRMDYGRTYLSVTIIKTKLYWKLESFIIETDNNYTLKELEELEEMTDDVFSQMDEALKQLFKYILSIRPSLKED